MTSVGGLSGGPVLRVKTNPIVRAELIGVVAEGGSINGHLYIKFARRLDVIRQDGSIGGA